MESPEEEYSERYRDLHTQTHIYTSAVCLAPTAGAQRSSHVAVVTAMETRGLFLTDGRCICLLCVSVSSDAHEYACGSLRHVSLLNTTSGLISHSFTVGATQHKQLARCGS